MRIKTLDSLYCKNLTEDKLWGNCILKEKLWLLEKREHLLKKHYVLCNLNDPHRKPKI